MDVAEDPINFLVEHIQVQYLMWIFELEVIHFLPISLDSLQYFSNFIVSFVELLQNYQLFLLEGSVDVTLHSNYIVEGLITCHTLFS